MRISSLCHIVLLAIGTMHPAWAQYVDPGKQVALWSQQCSAEVTAQPTLSKDEQVKQRLACISRKSEENALRLRSMTNEQREQFVQDMREQLRSETEASQSRVREEQKAIEAELNAARTGALGPEMQASVLCREELPKNGYQRESKEGWATGMLQCVAQRIPSLVRAASATTGFGSTAWCELENRKQRLRTNRPGDADCAVLAGKGGLDAQVKALCINEYLDLYIDPASKHMGISQYEHCHRRRLQELKAQSRQPAGEQPFGDRTRAHDYLNALYTDDLVTLQSVDQSHPNHKEGENHGVQISVLRPILQNYFALYPELYRNCLEPNAPTITLGEVHDEVTRDGNGIELRRQTVDTRHTIPVNQRFYNLARVVGIGASETFEDEVLKAIGGKDLGELAPGRIHNTSQEAMRSYKCDSAVMQRLEQKFIKYAPILLAAPQAKRPLPRTIKQPERVGK